MFIDEESKEIRQLNEMFVKVYDSLPTKIENSIFYPKLKQLLHMEIIKFTREQIELKQDLNLLRMNIGEALSETEIREYLDSLKAKYNLDDNNVGLDYHIEVTRYDYGVPIFVVIKRDIIYFKKFVFRFRKSSPTMGLDGLQVSGLPIKESQQAKKERYLKLMEVSKGMKDNE
jgi:hypothetical protein